MSFMNKTLIVNAHPKIDDVASFSIRTMNEFIKNYKDLIPTDHILEQINLYQDDIPMVDSTVLSAWDKKSKQEKEGKEVFLTKEEKAVMGRMDQIVEQFKSAGTYIIVMPLHNFNIPSKLKDYMDNILIARKTFAYTKNGSVGLLKNEGRRALLIQGSGGVYTNNDWYTDVEFSYKYLQSMFQFIGVEDFEIVRAQGTNQSIGVPERLEEAYKKVNEAAHRLAGTL
ncbi:NAD(P)H dehydrogenase [Circinella umbellata]|nr:NAD(P)H dehydrogenase [Circinella umbellata]